jgi:hypothetical protein
MKNTLASPLTIFLFAFSLCAIADEQRGPWERASVNMGVFFADIDSQMRWSGTAVDNGSNVDLDSDLGLDDDELAYRLDAYWRISRRNRIDFTWYNLDRDGTETLTGTLRIDDDVYNVNEVVDSDVDITFYKASYTFSFWQNDKFEFGPTIGAYVFDFDASFRSISDPSKSSSGGDSAPFPLIGAKGTYAFNDKLFLRGSFDWMDLEISDYDGDVIDLNVMIEYNFYKHLGAGIGYNYSDFTVDDDNNDFNAKFDYDYHGVQFYLKAFF